MKAGLESGELDANQVVMKREKRKDGGKSISYVPVLALAANGEYARLLLDHGADPDVHVEWGDNMIPMLHYFMVQSQVNMVKILVEEYDADVEAVYERFDSAPFVFLGLVAWSKKIVDSDIMSMMDILARSGADVNATINGKNVLFFLMDECKEKLLKHAVSLGVDVNQKKGSPLMAFAVMGDRPSMVSPLIEAGARVDDFVLLNAARTGMHLPVFRQLVDARVNSSKQQFDERIMEILLARAKGDRDVYEKLDENRIMETLQKCDPLYEPLEYEKWKSTGQDFLEYFENRESALE